MMTVYLYNFISYLVDPLLARIKSSAYSSQSRSLSSCGWRCRRFEYFRKVCSLDESFKHSKIQMDMEHIILAVVTLLLVQCLDEVLARRHTGSVCDSEPCQNGGQCIDESGPYGSKKFKCSCQEGYEGLTCQKRIDPCAAEPCDNGGICTPKGEHYHCICMEGFHGRNCENRKKKKNPCSDKPCGTHGICEVVNEEFICECYPGYHGPRCESEQHREVVLHPVHTSGGSNISGTLSSILIVLLIFLIILCLIFCIMCIHCSRVINRRAKLQSLQEARIAAGKPPPRVLGWIELSNKLCYEAFCCCCPEQKDEKDIKGPDDVTGIIVPVKEYNDMLTAKQEDNDLALRRSLLAQRQSLSPVQLRNAQEVTDFQAEQTDNIGSDFQDPLDNNELLLEPSNSLYKRMPSFPTVTPTRSRNVSLATSNIPQDLSRQRLSTATIGGPGQSRMNLGDQGVREGQSVRNMSVGGQTNLGTTGSQNLGGQNRSTVGFHDDINPRLSRPSSGNQGLGGGGVSQMAIGENEKESMVGRRMSVGSQSLGGQDKSKMNLSLQDEGNQWQRRMTTGGGYDGNRRQTSASAGVRGSESPMLQKHGSQVYAAGNQLGNDMNISYSAGALPADQLQNYGVIYNSSQCQQSPHCYQPESMMDMTPAAQPPSRVSYYEAPRYPGPPQMQVYPSQSYLPSYPVSGGEYAYPASRTNSPQYLYPPCKRNRVPRGSFMGFPPSKPQAPQSPNLNMTPFRKPQPLVERGRGTGNQAVASEYSRAGVCTSASKVDKLVFDSQHNAKQLRPKQNEEPEESEFCYDSEDSDDYEEYYGGADDDGYASTSRLSESDAGGRSRDPQSLQSYTNQAAENYRNRTQQRSAAHRSVARLPRSARNSPRTSFMENSIQQYSTDEDEDGCDGRSPAQRPRETLVHRKTHYGSYTIPRTRYDRERSSSGGVRRGDLMKCVYEPPAPVEDNVKKVKSILKKSSAYACPSNQQISTNSSPNNKSSNRRRAQGRAINNDKDDGHDVDDEEELILDPRRHSTRLMDNGGHGSPRDQRHYRSHQKYRRHRYPPSYPPPFYDDVA